jgi:preprotein translocase subunit SecY
VGSAEAVGAILAFLVAAGGLVLWLDLESVQRGQGAGQPLSIAIAAICAAAFFGIRLYRSARPRAA